MKKTMLPFLALALLGIGFILCCVGHYTYRQTSKTTVETKENSAQHHYELPKFIPAVWIQGQ